MGKEQESTSSIGLSYAHTRSKSSLSDDPFFLRDRIEEYDRNDAPKRVQDIRIVRCIKTLVVRAVHPGRGNARVKITFQEHKTYGVKSFFASTQQADVLVEKASLFSVKADISAFCIDGDPGSRPITELAIWKSFLVENNVTEVSTISSSGISNLSLSSMVPEEMPDPLSIKTESANAPLDPDATTQSIQSSVAEDSKLTDVSDPAPSAPADSTTAPIRVEVIESYPDAPPNILVLPQRIFSNEVVTSSTSVVPSPKPISPLSPQRSSSVSELLHRARSSIPCFLRPGYSVVVPDIKFSPFNDSQKYDFSLRILMIGTTSVGKTALTNKFGSSSFIGQRKEKATIGAELHSILASLPDGRNVAIHILDTQGSDRSFRIIGSYFKRCHGFILVADSSERSSFLDLSMWIRNAQDEVKRRNTQSSYHAVARYAFLNKIDKISDNGCEITRSDVEELESEFGVTCLPCSASHQSKNELRDLLAIVVQSCVDARDQGIFEEVEAEEAQTMTIWSKDNVKILRTQAIRESEGKKSCC